MVHEGASEQQKTTENFYIVFAVSDFLVLCHKEPANNFLFDFAKHFPFHLITGNPT